MRIARICYVEYKEGNSKRHYEQEVLKAVQNGCDMGDFNHSDQFPRKFRPFVKNEIHEKNKKFFTTKMEQTGFEPALNISADKGTNIHRYSSIYNSQSLCSKFTKPHQLHISW